MDTIGYNLYSIMASNSQLKDIKLGAWEFFIGASNIGMLANKDVDIEVDPSIVKSQVYVGGEATAKVFTGGAVPKVTLTLAHEHKAILKRIFSWMTGRSLSSLDGMAGSMDFNNAVGDVVSDFVLTGYLAHWDDAGNFYGNDSLNPHSVQLYKAFSAEALKWAFSASDNSMHEITFEGKPDFDRVKNSSGSYGFVTLPGAGVVFVNVNAGGSGYVSAPTVTVGTQFQASTAYTLNQQVAYNGNLYTVTIAGTSGLIGTAPVHTSGAVASGTATFTYAGPAASANANVSSGSVQSISIVTNGAGYTVAPAITFTGGAGTGATATANIG